MYKEGDRIVTTGFDPSSRPGEFNPYAPGLLGTVLYQPREDMARVVIEMNSLGKTHETYMFLSEIRPLHRTILDFLYGLGF